MDNETVGMGVGLVFIGIMALLSLAMLVFWVMMLINSAKAEKWGWFVMQLIFGVLVSLLYRLVAYEAPSDRLRTRRGSSSRGRIS